MTDELESWRELHQRVLEKDRHTPIAIDTSWPWPVQLVAEAVNAKHEGEPADPDARIIPTKFCPDCAHCIPNPRDPTSNNDMICGHPKSSSDPDRVSGRRVRMDCSDMRYDEDKCGVKAVYFEAKAK